MCEFPAASIRLGFGGEILKDDNTIQFYKISNDNELYQMQIQGMEKTFKFNNYSLIIQNN